MFGTLLAGKFQFLQISERCRSPRRAAKPKSVIMLPYFHRFLNLASTLRIHLARQAHLQTLSQNHKALQISSQIFQTCSNLRVGAQAELNMKRTLDKPPFIVVLFLIVGGVYLSGCKTVYLASDRYVKTEYRNDSLVSEVVTIHTLNKKNRIAIESYEVVSPKSDPDCYKQQMETSSLKQSKATYEAALLQADFSQIEDTGYDTIALFIGSHAYPEVYTEADDLRRYNKFKKIARLARAIVEKEPRNGFAPGGALVYPYVRYSVVDKERILTELAALFEIHDKEREMIVVEELNLEVAGNDFYRYFPVYPSGHQERYQCR